MHTEYRFCNVIFKMIVDVIFKMIGKDFWMKSIILLLFKTLIDFGCYNL